MKVALIQCPVWGTYDPPLALAQLSACLKKEGHEPFVLDLNIELYLKRRESYKDLWAWEQCGFWYDHVHVSKFFADNAAAVEQYTDMIVKSGSQAVCFSVATSSRIASLEFARSIKKKNKDIVIVFGGTLFFDDRWVADVLSDSSVDIVASGEGEATLCELAGLLEQKKSIDSCPGVSFRSNNSVYTAPPRTLIKDLDSLPFLDFSGLPLTNYDDSEHIPLLASRGCIQQCAFCSSRVFWRGYRRMSGKRIFDEIVFHKSNHKKIGHIDFLDLLINGDIKELHHFCELMINSNLKGDISWIANAVIRPEMTLELLKKMKEAGCKHLIYGIESGSERVLGLMKKRFRMNDADNVIKATHEAGIVITTNFMFGFPGESEEDFAQTLDFLRRNAKYLHRAYPSRTFCAIEEYSYLHGHLEEFGIKPNPPNHLYWESSDGKNIYPERLRRCEEFCKLASSLGIEVASGVQTSVELDRWFSLAHYYESKKDIGSLLDCCLRYYELEPQNTIINEKIINYSNETNKPGSVPGLSQEVASKLDMAVSSIKIMNDNASTSTKKLRKIGRERSVAMMKAEQVSNSKLSDQEYINKEIMLRSTPKAFFLQLSGPCNASCVFCSRGCDYSLFDLEEYRKRFESVLSYPLDRAEQIIFTGSGEFLLLPEAEDILDYFDSSFPHIDKMFSTNGSGLTPKICDKIVKGRSKYTIHVSMHASNSRLYQSLTRTENFDLVLNHLDYLLKARKGKDSPTIHLIFVATTLNIEDLPNFVKLAADLGVDKVICYYNYIYVPAQKYLSCFFKQELTNQMLDEAQKVADRLNMKIDLPPKFGRKEYPVLGVCREPWNQIMFNFEGHALPCDASEDCGEKLDEANNVDCWAIWNSKYYHNLRRSLINGTNTCFKYCFRANPRAVNDFRSHVIRRGRKEEINILWGDNF